MLINFSQKYTWLSKAALVSTPRKPPPPRNFVLLLCLCHQIMGKVRFLLSSWTVLETKPNCLSDKYTTQNVHPTQQTMVYLLHAFADTFAKLLILLKFFLVFILCCLLRVSVTLALLALAAWVNVWGVCMW